MDVAALPSYEAGCSCEAGCEATNKYGPKLGSHRFDHRADELAAVVDSSGDGDDLLNTKQTAHLLGYSAEWLQQGRSRKRGWGPPFIRLSPRCVRYKRSDIIAWLNERRHRSTKEYDTGRTGKTRRKDATRVEAGAAGTNAAA